MDSSSERTTLPTPGLETHKPPELWKIIVCCLSHLVFGNFFQQPPETNRVMQHAVSPPLSHHLAPTLILLIPAGGTQNFFWKVCVLRDSALTTVTVWEESRSPLWLESRSQISRRQHVMKLWQMLTCTCPGGGRCVCLWTCTHKNPRLLPISTPLRTLYSLTPLYALYWNSSPKTDVFPYCEHPGLSSSLITLLSDPGQYCSLGPWGSHHL